MPAPTISIADSPPKTPTEALDVLRDLLQRDPLAVHDGPEALAARTGAPSWVVEAAFEALTLDGGEVAA